MPERVPIALIRQLCYPAGYRLPHLNRLDYKWKNPAERREIQVTRFGPTQPIARNGVIAGNLTNDEYRFLIGKMDQKWLACNCRWCGEVLYNSKDRKEHKKEGCGSKLLDLYKRLLKKGSCMSCGRYTGRDVWGVPLCSVGCDNDWKFTSPPPFKRALQEEFARLKLGDKIP